MILVKEPLKIGDVVTLKGTPDQPMTVVDRLKDSNDSIVVCSWVFGGSPHSSVYPEDALVRDTEAEQELNAQQLAVAVEHMSSELSAKLNECAELKKLTVELFADRRNAIESAFKAYPEKRAETSTEAAQILLERYETIKNEANTIINRLMVKEGN